MAALHEYLMDLIQTEGKLFWDEAEDRVRTARFFATCPDKDRLSLCPWYFDDDCCPCCDGSNDMVALIQYDGKNIASLTVRTLEDELGNDPRILMLHVPACKTGDGTFNVQAISTPPLIQYSCHPIQFQGLNWINFK
jgi:hypothetical protein